MSTGNGGTTSVKGLTASGASEELSPLTAALIDFERETIGQVVDMIESAESVDSWEVYAQRRWDGLFNVVGEFISPTVLPADFLASVLAGIRDSHSIYQSIISVPIERRGVPILGEFNDATGTQVGDVRPLLQALGGGQSSVTIPGSGMVDGQLLRDWLTANGVPLSEKRIWLYEDTSNPRKPFMGHKQLDGLVFERPDEDSLLINPQDAWLRRTHYVVGDHTGCCCLTAPYVPNFGPSFRFEPPN